MLYEYEEGEYIFAQVNRDSPLKRYALTHRSFQGDVGDMFFVVFEGAIDIEVNKIIVATCKVRWAVLQIHPSRSHAYNLCVWHGD